MGAHDAYRVAGSLLSADLREAVPAEGDVALLDSDSLSVRAPVGLAFVCDVIDSPAVLALDRVVGRMPEDAADSLLVYASTGWRAITSTGRDTPGQRGMRCGPGSIVPDVQLRLPSGGAADVPVGAPVRTFRRHAYHLVANGGVPWLARTDASGTEPLVGPLAAGGLQFRLLNAGGLTETTLDEVVGVEFRMVLPGRSAPGAATTPPDTIVTVLQVRNR